MKNYLKKHLKLFPNWLIALFLFASGLLSGLALSAALNYKTGFPSEKHEGQYEFINPLLECEGSEDLISGELVSFKHKITDLVNKEMESKKAVSIAVYFRDLNDGPWFGIDEKEPFSPGSLLKVPIMMGFFKKAESDPAILTKQLKYDKKLSPWPQFIKPASEMEIGKSYTIEELIYRMIVYSDNEALLLLSSYDNGEIIKTVYRDLNIQYPADGQPYNITIRKYTSFFRILFNASYLNKDMSNKALRILADVDFNAGLVAGVPSNIPVAHKFGEQERNGQKQFHDCGTVYYPKNPYLLCAMARGDNFDDLISSIRDISRLAYEEVDKQVSKNIFK